MELIIAANWKRHKTAAETAAFCHTIRQNETDFTGVEVLICPPFTALFAAAAALEGSLLKLGAQNVHFEQQGAFTGEIAAPMLLEYGVEYVIIGHSERRHLMGEDDGMVRRKIIAALASGLKPILCVGETEREREQGLTEKTIEKQLSGALEGLDPGNIADLVVAYEPVWAIGTGKAASPDDAESAALLIRNFVLDNLGENAAAGLRIQYGGSVKAENIGAFVALPSIHGALVGGASLDADTFSALVQAARKAERS
jgi:triosephosphate isomerase (TIM)